MWTSDSQGGGEGKCPAESWEIGDIGLSSKLTIKLK